MEEKKDLNFLKSTKLVLNYLEEKKYTKLKTKLEKIANIEKKAFPIEMKEKILKGEFETVEKMIKNCDPNELFKEYLELQKQSWQIELNNQIEEIPFPRVNQSMCYDEKNGVIYLLGGDDSIDQYNDFWSFDLNTKKWSLIDNHFHYINDSNQKEIVDSSFNGYYKLFFDSKNGKLYAFQILIDSQSDQEENFKFFQYQFEMNVWKTIEFEKKGDFLLFKHIYNEILFDSNEGKCYCFCGNEFQINSFYCFDLNNLNWIRLKEMNPEKEDDFQFFVDRNDCSLMIDENNFGKKTIIICGGCGNDFRSDLVLYDIQKGKISTLHENIYNYGIQKNSMIYGFNNEKDGEIYILAMNNERNIKIPQRELWNYSIKLNKWKKCNLETKFNKSNRELSCNITQSSMIYDPKSNSIFSFFGIFHNQYQKENSEKNYFPDQFELISPFHPQIQIQKKKDPKILLDEIIFALRKRAFKEMIYSHTKEESTKYFQEMIQPLSIKEDFFSKEEMKKLIQKLYLNEKMKKNNGLKRIKKRKKLSDYLFKFFPEQVKEKIVDFL